jgi:ribulose-phosphate 3-epimerase
MVKVAPSILSADFSRLGEEVRKVEEGGADLIHCDVMDGHFVPNLTLGPMVLEGVKRGCNLPLDIHLMVENIPFFVELFAPLKPQFISFHIEEEKHTHRVVQQIKEKGIGVGVALNPATPLETLQWILPEVDMVLLMSVNPGFGGQKFLPFTLEKVRQLRKMAQEINPSLLIEVDGGVNDKTAPLLREAGVDILVAGSYIFGSSNYHSKIAILKGEG